MVGSILTDGGSAAIILQLRFNFLTSTTAFFFRPRSTTLGGIGFTKAASAAQWPSSKCLTMFFKRARVLLAVSVGPFQINVNSKTDTRQIASFFCDSL
jgi:hypothetical protein